MSKAIGLFYGTTTGKTESVADMIRDEFGGDIVTLHEIGSIENDDFAEYECLIIACPTWNIGELQSDWEGFFPELDDIDFSGKKVAYLGTGDQEGYPDNFMDAMGILAEKISAQGGETVGQWPTDGYDFNESKAVVNGKFLGLAIDEDNQSDLTEARVKAWVSQLKKEFGI
jgi:flavodoxin I